jgi:F-type H+-transporting ATPase subunit delta
MSEADDITARDAQSAERFSPDVGREAVGDIYARALLGAADNAGQTAAVLDELDGLVNDVFAASPKLETVLSSLLIKHEEKAALLDRVFGARSTGFSRNAEELPKDDASIAQPPKGGTTSALLSPLLLNFLKVVSRHGRLDCLRAIRKQMHKLYEEAQGAVRVRLTTATAVDSAQVEQIAASLAASLGRRPILETAVDPALVGGAVLRIGDTVYDGSVANQLQQVRQQMIDRSIHEIQSRRDHFSNTAGS